MWLSEQEHSTTATKLLSTASGDGKPSGLLRTVQCLDTRSYQPLGSALVSRLGVVPLTTPSLITSAMHEAVGVIGEQKTAVIERGAIIRFAEAIGDTNPAYPDVAPPTFLRSLGRAVPDLPDADSVPRALDGGSEWTYGSPVLAGDTVHIATTLDSVREREGKMGGMIIADYVTQYVNQHGETVATQRNTVIRMAVPV
jgi:hypothetical protein